MGIEDIQISEELETNAPSIKYRGNEGPKSPQEEQMIMQQQMIEQEQQMMAGEDYSSRAYRDKLIQQLMDTGGLDYGSASNEADRIIKIKLRPRTKAAFGGIMGVDGRRQYGLGSKFKKFVRKIIPNEVAKVAEVAAPFVAPFNPLAAGLMSGIGGFDRTGKIGSSIKSGLMNYGLGQGARYLGGADFQTGFDPRGGMSGMKYGFSKPTGSGGIKDLFNKPEFVPSGNTNVRLDQQPSNISLATGDGSAMDAFYQGVAPKPSDVVSKTKTGQILKTIKDFALDNKLLTGLAAGTLGMGALMGNMEEDEIQDLQRGEGLDIAGIRAEVIEAMKDSSGEKLKAIRIKYPFLGTRESKNQAAMAMGGRAGYAEGKKVDYEEDPLYINQDYDEMTVPLTEYEKALREMTKRERQEEFEMLKKVLKQRGNIGRDLGIAGGGQTGMERQMELLNFGTNTPDKDTGYKDNYSMKQRAAEYLDRPYFNEQYETGEHYAMGGRIRRAEGGLMDLGGMEKDYRAEGGFVPIGAKEKADDVPARLSVNEFVFTADAVRGAGQGDIDKGAEIMENVMKNLEQGGQLSEESQGMQGARDMFQTSQRLGEVV